MLDSSTEGIANTALMLRSTGDDPVMIVEGPSDKRFLEAFVAPEVKFVVGNGKPLVLGAVEAVRSSGEDFVLGIADNDHDSVLGIDRAHGVLYWDHADLEVMALTSGALDRYAAMVCSETKLDRFLEIECADSLAQVILDRAKPLGGLRLVSRRDDLRLPFDEVDLDRHISPTTMEVNVKGVAAAALQVRKGNQRGLDELVEQVSTAVASVDDARLLVNGHDAVRVLTAGLKRKIGSHGNRAPSAEIVHLSLLSAFSFEMFRKTAIFSSLSEFDATTGGKVLV